MTCSTSWYQFDNEKSAERKRFLFLMRPRISIRGSVHPFVHPSIHPLVGTSVNPTIGPFVSPSVGPSACQSIRPSVCQSIHWWAGNPFVKAWETRDERVCVHACMHACMCLCVCVFVWVGGCVYVLDKLLGLCLSMNGQVLTCKFVHKCLKLAA